MIDTTPYRVQPNQPADLHNRPTADDLGMSDKDADDLSEDLAKQLRDTQELFYADGRHALLVVFQAMDAAGKDSTTRHVFGRVNPQGCRVTSFKAPSTLELAHDYLWRIHANTPTKGQMQIFNRSHYEDVLVVRVRNLVDKAVWERRYDHINAFERQLADEGTTILKFYLHISKAYQRERFQKRLDKPSKHWKFNPDDLHGHHHWDDYRAAYEEAITRCSTDSAPWYVVPAECRRQRDAIVASAVLEALSGMDLRFPEPTFDPDTYRLPEP